MSVGMKAGQRKTEGKNQKKHKFVLDKYLLEPRFFFNKPNCNTEIMKMLISYIKHITFVFTRDNMKVI
jgi:hypothetical protein